MDVVPGVSIGPFVLGLSANETRLVSRFPGVPNPFVRDLEQFGRSVTVKYTEGRLSAVEASEGSEATFAGRQLVGVPYRAVLALLREHGIVCIEYPDGPDAWTWSDMTSGLAVLTEPDVDEHQRPVAPERMHVESVVVFPSTI